MGEHKEKEGKAYLSPRVQWHHWSPQDLALMLAVSLQLPVSHTAPHFTLAFLYFDQVYTTCVMYHMTVLVCCLPTALPCNLFIHLSCAWSILHAHVLFVAQNNPLLSFFKFHEQFTLYCNLDRCKNHLLEFDLAMSKVFIAPYFLPYFGRVHFHDGTQRPRRMIHFRAFLVAKYLDGTCSMWRFFLQIR